MRFWYLLFDIYTTYQHLQLQRVRRRLSEREQLFHVITESAADYLSSSDLLSGIQKINALYVSSGPSVFIVCQKVICDVTSEHEG